MSSKMAAFKRRFNNPRGKPFMTFVLAFLVVTATQLPLLPAVANAQPSVNHVTAEQIPGTNSVRITFPSAQKFPTDFPLRVSLLMGLRDTWLNENCGQVTMRAGASTVIAKCPVNPGDRRISVGIVGNNDEIGYGTVTPG